MEFDPEIHVSDEEGNPVLNGDGSFKKMNAGQLKSHRKHAGHKERKRRRGQFGPQLRLGAEKRDGFVRRWFNDVRGRIEQFTTQDDYEPVKDENGKVLRRAVGDGKDAVLLEIPVDWYEENQREKRKLISDPTTMKEAKTGEGEYIPGGGNSALR